MQRTILIPYSNYRIAILSVRLSFRDTPVFVSKRLNVYTDGRNYFTAILVFGQLIAVTKFGRRSPQQGLNTGAV